MEISIIEKIQRLPVQTEESLRDAFSVLLSVEDCKCVDPFSQKISQTYLQISLFCV